MVILFEKNLSNLLFVPRPMHEICRCFSLMAFITFIGCTSSLHEEQENETRGFEQVASNQSGISFTNTISPSDTLNYDTFPYIYMGAGVALGDINNDGLTDIFLTGNMTSNALYLNKGEMSFDDISVAAKINGDGRWYTGVTMVDINEDGWLDIYVSVSGLGENTANQLFINNGDLTFTEMASQYGLADASNSIQSAFFDYDNDGDLDVYVANYPTIPLTMPNDYYYEKMQANKLGESGHLYRNNGSNKFQNMTEEAGVLNFGLSLGIAISDFNNDGWQDLYVSNDFNVPDYFYLNNGDGTFSEKLQETTRQISMFGMGVDAADFNNDGLMDLFQVDMTPADHYRSKTNMATMDPASFYTAVRLGFHHQYMQNSLQVNDGISSNFTPVFSNISRLAGMATTDWSWAPLFADFDNDGLKDVIITNGMRLDVNNNDLLNRENSSSLIPKKINMNKAPSTPIANYLFRNKGNYEFEDVSKKWKADQKGFSNGVAYGDLDNDGDLDIVINNIDHEASLLKNNNHGANHIRIELKGADKNQLGIGAKVKITSNDTEQWMEQHLSRGFQSSVEPVLHFGLGKATRIDALEITWPDGKVETKNNIASNQTLQLNYKNAKEIKNETQKARPAFKDISASTGINFTHVEDLYDDFYVEPLLPHQNSQLGPALAVADINQDGLDDIFIGNAKDSSGSLFVQSESGTFNEMDGPWSNDMGQEDTGAIFFDADADGDQDLYVVSGGNSLATNAGYYQDRFYINTTEGFMKSEHVLPKMNTSGLTVVPGDYDGDGDMDLFVGGRIKPGYYGQPPRSYILENQGGANEKIKFLDVTSEKAPELEYIGMVTDAFWQDFNDDGFLDLIIAGEWMPLTFFQNEGNSLKNATEELGMQNTVGWWNSLATTDMDNDGDMDIVAGNLGLNSKYHSSKDSPFEVYINDFDGNKRQDIVLSVTKKGTKLPLRGRECSSQQVPIIKRKFKTFDAFASADLNEIYGEQLLDKALHYTIDTFAHHWFENKGNGKYERHQLPIEAQFSSINDIVIFDYNADEYPDLLVAGNLYDTEVETPRSDAGIGLVLQNDEKKGFDAVSMSQSGLLIDDEVKAIAEIKLGKGDKEGFVFAINNGKPILLSIEKTASDTKLVSLNKIDQGHDEKR